VQAGETIIVSGFDKILVEPNYPFPWLPPLTKPRANYFNPKKFLVVFRFKLPYIAYQQMLVNYAKSEN
jgi:hypothetical protein